MLLKCMFEPLFAGKTRSLSIRFFAPVLGLLMTAGASAQTPSTPTPSDQTSPPQSAATTSPPAASAPSEPEFKLILEPRAMALLKATSDRLAAAKALSFTAVVGYEFPSKLGPPIVYTSRYDVTMQRPAKLKIVMPGDGPASEFYYDGKTMMAYAPAQNLVATAKAPPTIEAALMEAFKTAAIYYPFTDLLVADPYAALTNGATLAFYIGPSGVVGGVKTDMVAWANDDVFLQIWIGADDKLPHRVRAVYSADPLRLRHEMDITNWRIDPVIAPGVFTSAKALAAKPIMFANPVSALPQGMKPIVGQPAAGAGAIAAPAKPQ
jgi:hypothetical protein